jgi:hypothetical protein
VFISYAIRGNSKQFLEKNQDGKNERLGFQKSKQNEGSLAVIYPLVRTTPPQQNNTAVKRPIADAR